MTAHFGDFIVDDRFANGALDLRRELVRAAERAVAMALELEGPVDALLARWRKVGHDVWFGVGIALGYANVGMIGFEGRRDYTALGPVVNLAARLEGANKAYGTRLMVGELTYRQLPRRYLMRRLDHLVVKGKARPVRVYEALGTAGDLPPGAAEGVRRFHAALALYYRRRFAEAAERFAALAEADPVAALYRDRAEAYAAAPPPADWDRSHSLMTK